MRNGELVRECYFAAEIERMLGMAAGNLYRKGELEKLLARGFPESLTLGRYRFPKTKVDAWLRGNPLPKAPANDVEAPLQANSNAEWQAYLSANYAHRS